MSVLIGAGCGADEAIEPVDPNTAPEATIDRFSAESGTVMVRTADNGLPEAGEPIDYDQPPFMTMGLGPDGQVVTYYDFDVRPTTPAPIFVLFRESEDVPVSGQLNIIDAVPGDAGYNDLWLVTKVIVPDDYVANTMTSLDELMAAGFAMETTDTLVNCPVVPKGSTARQRVGGGSSALNQGWYRGEVVYYFTFEEAPLAAVDGAVPVSPIYITFNVNPGEEGGGPPSGFVTEPDSAQTHNVLETVPGDPFYSPLWIVSVYDNAQFDNVVDLASAATAGPYLEFPAVTVNCPVASIE